MAEAYEISVLGRVRVSWMRRWFGGIGLQGKSIGLRGSGFVDWRVAAGLDGFFYFPETIWKEHLLSETIKSLGMWHLAL